MAMIPEAANMEEILAKESIKKYGRPIAELTKEELDALYTDYEGMRDVQNAEYQTGQDMFDKDITQGIQAGDVYVGAGAGNAIAELAMKYAGNKMRKEAKGELGKLSEKYKIGSKAGGDVAAYESGEDRNLMNSILRNRAAAAAPTTAAVPPPAQPPMTAPAAPRPPLAAAATPPQGAGQPPPQANPGRAINAAYSMMMQGNGAQNPPPMPNQMPAPSNPTAAQATRLRQLAEEERMRAMGAIR